MGIEKQITLYKKEGSSDKVYRLTLEQHADGLWTVAYANGKRGQVLRGDLKTKIPVSFEQALAVYESTVKSKLKDGYTPSEDGVAYSDSPDESRVSGNLPMLLTDIDDTAFSIDHLLSSDEYLLQPKHDGERAMLDIYQPQFAMNNRKGLVVGHPTAFLEYAKANLPCTARTVIDGEFVEDTLIAFDLTFLNGQDLRSLPCEQRLAKLQELIPNDPDAPIFVTPTARTHEQKVSLYRELLARNAEGAVFKKVSSQYEEGRSKAVIKDKFVATATFRVAHPNTGKSSVAIELLNASTNAWVGVGNVTIPVNQKMPAKGDLIECEYLYAFKGGSVFQPVFLKVRSDLDQGDALLSQLKYKADPQSLMAQTRQILSEAPIELPAQMESILHQPELLF